MATKPAPKGLKFSEASHRYWYQGKPITGVTTLLGKGLPKPALVRWAAKAAAEYVADNLEVLNALPDRESIIATVKQSPWTSRDRAAVRGTDVHAIAEDLIHGREVDVPKDLAGYVNGYVAWLDAFAPEVILTERPVVNEKWWYAGKFDAIVTIGGERLLLDWKTSKGVYGETALQCAAYAGADEYLDEAGVMQPMPEVDGIGVVHITPNGTDFYRFTDREAAWKDWLHCLWVANSEDRIRGQITIPEDYPTAGDAA